MTEPLRIVLVDDQQLVSAGVRMIVDSQDDMTVVGTANTGLEAIAILGETSADVVLMDIRMPDMDGIEATRQILALHDPAPKIIILTTFDLDEYLLAAIRAGASGFLLKNAPPPDLLAAIRTVHSGDGVIAPSSTRRLIEHVATRTPMVETSDQFDCLTDREREVLLLVAKGMSNFEISKALFLGEATVKTHVSKILEKLGLRDRVQAVVEAYEGGLVRPG
ncbi:MAG: response regulator transcription factor [Propionibacteriaceae bacterium]|jgi:DNA-binding NarL/FixJ family response regulator|nr:response regulator transcription factor [Propionibacteriaceae bacterium]